MRRDVQRMSKSRDKTTRKTQHGKKINEQCNVVLKARSKKSTNIYPEKIPSRRNTNLSERLL